jgi:hypothetical protein
MPAKLWFSIQIHRMWSYVAGGCDAVPQGCDAVGTAGGAEDEPTAGCPVSATATMETDATAVRHIDPSAAMVIS